jgi:hypothetical protein
MVVNPFKALKNIIFTLNNLLKDYIMSLFEGIVTQGIVTQIM